mmetsp:Transcript_23076/g.77867  ORF Transcript_23076/g.77867 Transcript_23076/m.77867 type:complete len:135 (+) Transcript_23076:90-494(+)
MDKAKLVAHYQAAVDAHRQNELDTALEHYRACVAIQSIPAVHNNMAAILLSQGDKTAAEENWRLAVEGKPDYAEAHFNLAVVLSESGDDAKLAEARRHCELAMEHKEGYVQAHHPSAYSTTCRRAAAACARAPP